MVASVGERKSGPRNEVCDSSRDQDFARFCARTDTSGNVDSETGDVAVTQLAFAGV
jgi:hypothetical protein